MNKILFKEVTFSLGGCCVQYDPVTWGPAEEVIFVEKGLKLPYVFTSAKLFIFNFLKELRAVLREK